MGASLKFTDRSLQALRPKAERYEVWENNSKGFGLRISPKGRKSFIFLYRFAGKPRRLTIGGYPQISLATAHKRHAEARELLNRDIDPGAVHQAQKAEHRTAPTVKQLADEYIEKWAKLRKRSWAQDQWMLNRYVLPHWEKRKARDITRRAIILLLDPIAETAPVQANRVYACVRKMFRFAVERGILETTPCTFVKPPGGREKPRERALDENEIKTFWVELEKARMNPLTPLALKLTLVTAQRPGEVIAAEWDELDRVNGVWTLPAHKTKNARKHTVPLSGFAMELLAEIDKLCGESRFLFPGPRKDQHGNKKPMDHSALSQAIKRNMEVFGIAPFVPHDLRRTAATHLTDLLGSDFIVSKILNHKERHITGRVYDMNAYLREKRTALEKWSRKLKTILEGKVDKVITLRG